MSNRKIKMNGWVAVDQRGYMFFINEPKLVKVDCGWSEEWEGDRLPYFEKLNLRQFIPDPGKERVKKVEITIE